MSRLRRVSRVHQHLSRGWPESSACLQARRAGGPCCFHLSSADTCGRPPSCPNEGPQNVGSLSLSCLALADPLATPHLDAACCLTCHCKISTCADRHVCAQELVHVSSSTPCHHMCMLGFLGLCHIWDLMLLLGACRYKSHKEPKPAAHVPDVDARNTHHRLWGSELGNAGWGGLLAGSNAEGVPFGQACQLQPGWSGAPASALNCLCKSMAVHAAALSHAVAALCAVICALKGTRSEGGHAVVSPWLQPAWDVADCLLACT